MSSMKSGWATRICSIVHRTPFAVASGSRLPRLLSRLSILTSDLLPCCCPSAGTTPSETAPCATWAMQTNWERPLLPGCSLAACRSGARRMSGAQSGIAWELCVRTVNPCEMGSAAQSHVPLWHAQDGSLVVRSLLDCTLLLNCCRAAHMYASPCYHHWRCMLALIPLAKLKQNAHLLLHTPFAVTTLPLSTSALALMARQDRRGS